MNEGSLSTRQTSAFGPKTLLKFKDVQSKYSKITLLGFIVQSYIHKNDFGSNLPLSIPQPRNTKRTATLNFDEGTINLEKLKK